MVADSIDVYFGYGVQRGPLDANSRGKAADVVAIPCLWIDLDIFNPVAHKQQNIPKSQEEAQTFVRNLGLPEPTAWISSGNGLYLQWWFNSVWVLQDDAERARALPPILVSRTVVRQRGSDHNMLIPTLRLISHRWSLK